MFVKNIFKFYSQITPFLQDLIYNGPSIVERPRKALISANDFVFFTQDGIRLPIGAPAPGSPGIKQK